MTRLDDIEARVKAATPGPWVADDDGGVSTAWPEVDPVLGQGPIVDTEGCGMGNPDDAEFIAHARTDVEDLAAFARDVLAMPTVDPGTAPDAHAAGMCRGANETIHGIHRAAVAHGLIEEERA